MGKKDRSLALIDFLEWDPKEESIENLYYINRARAQLSRPPIFSNFHKELVEKEMFKVGSQKVTPL